MSDLPSALPRVPAGLASLLGDIRSGFPAILGENLVGIYLWGSLTYDAFDERCSDVDSVVVTRHDVDETEFSALGRWFAESLVRNPWTARLDMRSVINGEFLDRTSRCCGFYSGRLIRHGSDGNPIIWLNVGQCGITLWGRDARLVAPAVGDRCLDDALRLELGYLKQDLAQNAGDRSAAAFRHNAYAVLTACRILHTARHRALVAKRRAYDWAIAALPPRWHLVITAAWENRARAQGTTTPGMETAALDFVRYVEELTAEALAGPPDPRPR